MEAHRQSPPASKLLVRRGFRGRLSHGRKGHLGVAKIQTPLAKNKHGFSLPRLWGRSTFLATSTGKLGDGPSRRATAGRVGREGDGTPSLEGSPRRYRETDGNGTRSEYRTGILRDRRSESRPTAGREACGLLGDEESGLRTAPAAGFGQRRYRTELGPRPDTGRIESPERVEAPAKTPSGFLAL